MKSPVRRSVIAGAAAVAVGAAVTAFAVPALGQTPSADEIVRKAAETVKNTNTAHSVLTVSTTSTAMGGPITVEVWGAKPGKGRAEVRQAPIADLNGAVAVSDGANAWLYQKSQNQVYTATEADLAALKKDGKAHPVQQALDWNSAVDQLLKNVDARVVGSEAVEGVDAFKLEVTPKDPEHAAQGPATIWIAKNNWAVVKATVPSDEGTATVVAKNVQLNPTLDPALFTFPIPANAKVIPASSLAPQPMTPDQARALSSVKVLLPTYLPAGAVEDGISRVGENVVARYTIEKSGFTVVSSASRDIPRASRAADTISLRGTTATVVTDRDGVVLTWQENGFSYVIAGGLTLDEAKKVAESLR